MDHGIDSAWVLLTAHWSELTLHSHLTNSEDITSSINFVNGLQLAIYHIKVSVSDSQVYLCLSACLSHIQMTDS